MIMLNHYIFDAYGTIFDLKSALKPAAERLGEKAPAVLNRWRTLQLDYAWLSALGDNYVDFATATRSAFKDAFAEHGIHDLELLDQLQNAFGEIDAYPDARDTLTRLKQHNKTVAILSNGTPDMLSRAAESAAIDSLLDQIISVESVKTYKPSPVAYALGADFMGQEPASIYFVSSNWWDVTGALNFGYRAIWIDRGDGHWPPSFKPPEITVPSLSALSELDT